MLRDFNEKMDEKILSEMHKEISRTIIGIHELYENLRRNIIQISGGLIEGILKRIHGRNPQAIQAERPRKIPEVTL